MTEPIGRRRNLILIRAGRGSLHPTFTDRLADQNFDYALSWYGQEDPAALGMAEGAVFVHRAAGSKMTGLVRTFDERWETVAAYDRVWLPDDDLASTPETVSELFDICAQADLEMAQPGLGEGSYVTMPITAVHPGFQLRFTSFVEQMAPVFSRGMLAKVRPTIDRTLTGWGVDHVWSYLAPVGSIAVVDKTPVVHTRPLFGGNGYQVLEGTGRTNMDDFNLALTRYAIEPRLMVNYAGLRDDGSVFTMGDPDLAAIEAFVTYLRDLTAPLCPENDVASYVQSHLQFLGSRWRYFLHEALNERLEPLGIGLPVGELLPPRP